MNKKIEHNLKLYFMLCKQLEMLEGQKQQLRAFIQNEMVLNNMDAYTTDVGVAKFKMFNRESIDKERLRELVAPNVLGEIIISKEVRQFEIRSAESLEKSRKALNGGNI